MPKNSRIDPVYEYVDKKVKSLKVTITQLRRRIENLEISGLQEQVTSLDSQVKHIDSLVLRLEQDEAHLRISHHLLWALWYLLRRKDDQNATTCIHFVRESAAAALTEVRASRNPLKVTSDWYSKCADYFRKHGNFEVFV